MTHEHKIGDLVATEILSGTPKYHMGMIEKIYLGVGGTIKGFTVTWFTRWKYGPSYSEYTSPGIDICKSFLKRMLAEEGL